MSDITVIIPAYNAAKTLERSVLSVVEQTQKNLLIVIVNDGSKDGTLSIARSLAARYSNITVVDQPNGGCYMARLAGLKILKTEYFGFLDADDYIEPKKYERMLEFARKYDLDIVKCDLKSSNRVSRRPNELYLSRSEVLERIVRPCLVRGEGMSLVWDKLYRNNSFDFDSFERADYTTFEDLVYNLQFFLNAERVGWLREPLHTYEVTEASATRNYSKKNVLGLESAIQARAKLIPRYGLGDVKSDMDTWTIKNATNAVLTAIEAPMGSFAERCRVVKMLLQSEEIRPIIQRHAFDRRTAILKCVGVSPLAVFAILCARRMRRHITCIARALSF